MILFFYIFICLVFVNACEQHQTCSDCIRDFKACVWCASETMRGPRCISERSVQHDWCPGEIQNPTSTKNVLSHQLDSSLGPGEIIQIKPKNIEMNLRPGQTINFDFSYTAAENYPVDLYFLYDASMELPLFEKHVENTEQVIKWIQNVTNSASIGFGTFIDKNALPFISIKNETLSYSFRHDFSLSRDQDGFMKAIKDVKIVSSTFIDNVNGGFDALAQAIVCKDIGWRNISRKIVIFLSDNLYHTAGDSMAAGIINPYDGRCYLNNGKYTKELEMDYPSPYMINKLASDQKVTIIFVISMVKSSYDPLTNVINGAHVIYPIQTWRHSETVASKLKETYETITTIVKLKVDINPNYENKINITFEPDCNKLECKVEQNKELKVRGKITVLEYFEADKINVDISVTGIKEKLSLDIRLIDECNCTKGDNTLCNGGGTRICGICECYENRSGKSCECSSNNVSANNDKSTCMMPNSTIECSGRGSCICGFCRCGEQRYRGQYCECDDESCPKDKNGRRCGHGKCQCGECVCETGWLKNSQRTCNCEDSTDQCKTGHYECSNYGDCDCNKCKCPAAICEWDARSSQNLHCNPLPCHDCHDRQCHLLESYALSRSDANTPCGSRVNVTSVKILDNGGSWMLCSDVRTNVGCYTKFIYRYDDEKYGVHLIVQSESNCAESAYIYGGACLGGLILIGILTLLGWKVLTVYRDRKEYRRFSRQHQASMKKSEPKVNPWFKSANTTVANPIYECTS